MPTWKQLIILTTSLFIGGCAGALLAAAPAMFSQIPLGAAYAPKFNPSNIILILPLAALIIIPATIILGLPAFFFLRTTGTFNIIAVALVGILASSVTAAGLFGIADLSVIEELYFAAIGLVSSVVAFSIGTYFGATLKR